MRTGIIHGEEGRGEGHGVDHGIILGFSGEVRPLLWIRGPGRTIRPRLLWWCRSPQCIFNSHRQRLRIEVTGIIVKTPKGIIHMSRNVLAAG